MKSSVMAAALLAFACAFVVGCVDCTLDAGETRVGGSGHVVESERAVSGVTGVHLATFGDLRIMIADREEFVIEAEDNLIEYIETEIRGGILHIETRRHVSIKPKKKVRFYLTLKELDTVRISSSGDILAPYVETERLDVGISSSGDLVMKGVDATQVYIKLSSSGDADIGRIEARDLDIGISSSGDVTIEDGAVRFQEIRISSSGDYIAEDVRSENAQVSISSSGDAYIHVDGKLNASLSSSGSLYYTGHPSATVTASSSGRARRVGR
ncbi:MAG: DUF2807 domain-containing protein [bacterium]|jgi:hypothetical protein